MIRIGWLSGLVALTLSSATLDGALRVELETYYVVDGRAELGGTIVIDDLKRFGAAIEGSPDRPDFHLQVNSLSREGEAWVMALPIGEEPRREYAFTLPLARMARGYNRLRVSVGSRGEGEVEAASKGEFLPLGKGGPVVDFAVLEERQVVSQTGSFDDPQSYLDFVVDTVEKLMGQQSCPLGGAPEGVRLVTVVGKDAPTRRHLVRGADGVALHSEPVSVQGAGLSPEFFEPYGADLDSWMLLDLLSEVSGDPKYAARVTEMAEAFVPHGFDPRSGLGYMGEETQLDVFRLEPVNRRRSVRPLYKHGPDLPMERLWRHGAEEMKRMSKAMFYGLVTDPKVMAYNRFCDYGFDDRVRKPLLEPSERHGAFESAAGGMIQHWGSCFARTGDRECLEWAQKMADKWQAAQHPKSGLVPYTLPWNREPTNPNTRGGAKFAVALLKAAGDIGSRPEGKALAAQLREMGLKLARGVARFGYVDEEGKFRESLRLDGRSLPIVTSRFFSSRKEKEEVMKRDSKAGLVPVYGNGESFYFEGPYWRYTTGVRTPLDLATAAWLTKDPELIGRVMVIAEGARQESRELTSEFTPQGKWTFSGTGLYLKMMVLLHEATGDPRYLQWARELADEELARLGRVKYPEWWRLGERSVLMEGLLRLYVAIRAEKAG